MLEGRQAATTNRQKAQGSNPSFNYAVAKKEALHPKGRGGRKDPGMVASVCVPGSGHQQTATFTKNDAVGGAPG